MAKDVTPAPAKGATQPSTEAQEKEVVVRDAREANTASPITGAAPGTSEPVRRPSDGITLSIGGLGLASEVKTNDDPEYGEGEYVVVLTDILTGLNQSYPKGSVRKISNFIANYGDEAHRDQNLADATRLFDLKAIRLANREEHGKGQVELVNESDELRMERERRRKAEEELDQFRKAASLDANLELKEGETMGQAGKVTAGAPQAGDWQ